SALPDLEIASRPYRLRGPIGSDLQRTRTALNRGDVDGALTSWSGDLLPASEAPAIRRWGRREGDHLRELLLESGTAAQLWRYAQRPEAEDDLEVLMAILELAPADAPERSAAASRARTLRGEG
ncbi:MAG: transcriptional regulator, partial [Brachybacterium sp.]|nr:transcriptional regulator [Brachybacterium sp.]